MKRTLFIDESGMASLRSVDNDPFIITSLIIEKRDMSAIEGFFKYIKMKYHIQLRFPFHSYDIYEKTSKTLSDKELKNLSKDLADFISFIPIKIKVYQIDKNKFKKALGIKSDSDFKGSSKRNKMKDFPYKIMFTYLLNWFASYLQAEDIGDIVVDSRKVGDKNLIEALHQAESPECCLKDDIKSIIKHRCTAICFAKKTYLSGSLELTDFISYTCFFKARKMLNKVKLWGFPVVWRVIKKKMEKKKIIFLNNQEIKRFFKVPCNGAYNCLKKS